MERLDVRIEPLHPRDAERLEELVRVSGDPDRLAVAADLYDFLWIESLALLAFGGPGLVGYLIGDTDDQPVARVRWLYTRPEARRHGVAAALVRAFARRALLDDCLEITFDCGRPRTRTTPDGGFLRAIGLTEDSRPGSRPAAAPIVDILAGTRRR